MTLSSPAPVNSIDIGMNSVVKKLSKLDPKTLTLFFTTYSDPSRGVVAKEYLLVLSLKKLLFYSHF